MLLSSPYENIIDLHIKMYFFLLNERLKINGLMLNEEFQKESNAAPEIPWPVTIHLYSDIRDLMIFIKGTRLVYTYN